MRICFKLLCGNLDLLFVHSYDAASAVKLYHGSDHSRLRKLLRKLATYYKAPAGH